MQRHGSERPSQLPRLGKDSFAQLQQRTGVGAGHSCSITACFPHVSVLQTWLILHEVPVIVTAFTISRSAARADDDDDDDGVNNNNKFYLYHTFKTENEISVQFTDMPGREQPSQLLLDQTAAVQKAAAGEGYCNSPGIFWPCQLGAPHPYPVPLTQLYQRG